MIFDDPRAQKILGFFKAKGFLIVPKVSERHHAKMTYEEIEWVGNHAEPRIWQVLPAALLHYPSSFLFKDQYPKKIHTIIECIKRNQSEGPALYFVPYKELKQWADFSLPDKRTKPQSKKKKNLTFRLSPRHYNDLDRLAKYQQTTKTKIIEEWIESASVDILK